MDFVAVLLVGRENIKGGERVFEADGPNGLRFTLTEPWSALLLDDARVIHESTPIQPLEGRATATRSCSRSAPGVPGTRVAALLVPGHSEVRPRAAGHTRAADGVARVADPRSRH
ncbi:hypothetical protein A176_007750 [Myxococcus hansupus]|uniref:2OG-Fe dioxygenase family protein n=1 Tax=Pseudomyxococcus hansupus TaxID=1297742 RepID=A0A0H4X9X6_9BACT|nr:hypothetical protein A176_007750 [Myxococcus hansupus]